MSALVHTRPALRVHRPSTSWSCVIHHRLTADAQRGCRNSVQALEHTMANVGAWTDRVGPPEGGGGGGLTDL